MHRFSKICPGSLSRMEVVYKQHQFQWPGKRNGNPYKRFSKMISLNGKNLESVLLTEPHGRSVGKILVFLVFSLRFFPHQKGWTGQIGARKTKNWNRSFSDRSLFFNPPGSCTSRSCLHSNCLFSRISRV